MGRNIIGPFFYRQIRMEIHSVGPSHELGLLNLSMRNNSALFSGWGWNVSHFN